MGDLVKQLRDPDFRGVLQHLRSWQNLDELHQEAAAAIEQRDAVIRELVEALERIKSGIALIPNKNRDDICQHGKTVVGTCDRCMQELEE